MAFGGIRSIQLGVEDIDRSLAFYESILGLNVFEVSSSFAALGGTDAFLHLTKVSEPKVDGEAGLYHTALLYPDRATLGQVMSRVEQSGHRWTGAADHWVSEALYLDDPDGNGVELYRDRPMEDWPRENGQLQMSNEPLDKQGIQEAGKAIDAQPFEHRRSEIKLGHVHLESADMDADHEVLGRSLELETMVALPKAIFLGWNGYHHHLAINNWAKRAPRSTFHENRIGLQNLVVEGPVNLELKLPSGLMVHSLMKTTTNA